MGYFGVLSLCDYLDGVMVEEMVVIDVFNVMVVLLIVQFGFIGDDGELSGGGGIGVYLIINNQDFVCEFF